MHFDLINPSLHSSNALFAVGSMVKTAVIVREKLAECGIDATVVNARFVKPIDKDMVDELAANHDLIVSMEENVANGGFGDKVIEYANETGLECDILQIAIPDEYVEHGNVEILKNEIGIDAESIVEKIMKKKQK